MEDKQIIKLFWNRSENAIRELANKYGRLCMSLSYNILKNNQDAEECVNDSYLVVWNTIPPQKPKYLSAYVCKITRNLSIKKYNSNTAQKRNCFYDQILDELENCLMEGNVVEEQIIGQELATYINSYLKMLKEQERVIFVQRYWFGYSITEISKYLDVSRNYVRVHLYRIREKLKEYLRKEGVLL